MDPVRELVANRPLAHEAIRAARPGSAKPLTDNIYMSAGSSNAYMVTTSEGRVIINTGLGFEAAIHKQAFDAICPGPTPYILLTQGHVDHIGGVALFREEATQLLAQQNLPLCQADDERIAARRESQSYYWFSDIIDDAMELMDESLGDFGQDKPVADIAVDDRYDFSLGGVDFELYAVPGGETIDSLAIWLPQRRILFSGNMFGPLFPHFPNINTIRGDKYRDLEMYLDSLRRLRALQPGILITGHGEPIEGEELIDTCLQRLDDAVSFVLKETLKGIAEGKSIYDLMREVQLPDELYVGQNYGRVPWAVRTIWEQYMGWFKAEDSSELYAHRIQDEYPALLEMIGHDKLLTACEQKLENNNPHGALALLEILLKTEPEDAEILRLAIDVHHALLDTEGEGDNFWLGGWLNSRIRHYREELENLQTLNESSTTELSCTDVFDRFPDLFIAEATKKSNVIVQYDMQGDGGGQWHTRIREGTLQVGTGPHPDADCTLTMQAEDFVAIMCGRLNPIKAFMQGRIKAEGDRAQARVLKTAFRRIELPKANKKSKKTSGKAKDIIFKDLENPRLSLPQKLALSSSRFLPTDIDADQLLNIASKQTGLTDFGPEDFRERLNLLVEEYNSDDGLTRLGKNRMRGELLRMARNHLIIQDRLNKHPDINQEPIKTPLIVAGLPRSGTTHLVNLLAADQRFASMPLWLSHEPFNAPGQERAGLILKLSSKIMARLLGNEFDPGNNDPRYLRENLRWSAMQIMGPEVAAMHPMNPDHIAEEVEVMSSNFGSYYFEWTSVAPRYRDYYLNEDQRPHYEYMKNVQRLWQRESGETRPWVLKSPQHMEQLPVLKQTYPDATLLVTHRDPVAVIQSAATMMAYPNRMLRKTVEPRKVLDYWTDRIERILRRFVETRNTWGAGQSTDILFHEFMANDMATLEKIYAAYGLPLSRTARQQLQAFLDAHPRGRFGKIIYNLKENFGVDPEELQERFDFYYDVIPVRKEH